MGNAFPYRSDCPVPSVEAITGDLVSSCSIDSADEPTFCFPFERVPLVPPPSADFGCYGISTINAGAHYNNCLVTADLDLNIGPGPLGPNIAGNLLAALGSDVLRSAIDECSRFVFEADVTYPNFNETGFCEPVFNFDLGIPCPPIKMDADNPAFDPQTEPGIKVTGGKTIIITNSSVSMDCSYDFHIALNLGIDASFCFVCDVSLVSSSSLVVKKRCIQFKKGVLMGFNDCVVQTEPCDDACLPW